MRVPISMLTARESRSESIHVVKIPVRLIDRGINAHPQGSPASLKGGGVHVRSMPRPPSFSYPSQGTQSEGYRPRNIT